MKPKLLGLLLVVSIGANLYFAFGYYEMRRRTIEERDRAAILLMLGSIASVVQVKQGDVARLESRWETEADAAAEYLFRALDESRTKAQERDIRLALGKYVMMRKEVPFKPLALSNWESSGQATIDGIVAAAHKAGSAQRRYLEESIRRFSSENEKKG